MNETIKEFIEAARDDRASDVSEKFEAIMAEKVKARLEAMRIEVAKKLAQ